MSIADWLHCHLPPGEWVELKVLRRLSTLLSRSTFVVTTAERSDVIVSAIHLNKLINLTFVFLGFHLGASDMNHVMELYVYM
jgi:hypothetical protein